MKTAHAIAAAILLWATAAGLPARAAEMPPLVSAFVQQLVRQCGGEMSPGLAAQVVQQVDLNGDKLDDWVIDEGRYPCPNRAAAFKDAPRTVTVFLSRADGRALPALQYSAFGSRIEGRPDTGYALWLTVGGADCHAEVATTRCDRKVVWRAPEGRLALAEPEGHPASEPPAKPLPRIPTASRRAP